MKRNLLRMVSLTMVMMVTSWVASQAHAQYAAGVYRGGWTSAPGERQRLEHRGPLRVRLIPTGQGTYEGRFSGRFALIVPYFYRAPVIEMGGALYSEKRLGPMGTYQMQLVPSGNGNWQGGWSAGQSHGRIGLRRVR